jgi:hypothetical protein
MKETLMQRYGVYTRTSDTEVWRLEYITNLTVTRTAEEINVQYGLSTLIVGPLTTFPEFVET